MTKFIKRNSERKNSIDNEEKYWKKAIEQALTSGGSMVVFVPNNKVKLLVE